MAFGRELQTQRERLGISLDAVAEGTKVALRHLVALEDGDFGSLPGGVFNKGIVRSYCRYLGLDEDGWLARFADEVEGSDDQDWAAFAENVRRTRAGTPPAMRRRWWGVALMVCALAGVTWALWHFLVKTRVLYAAPPQWSAVVFPHVRSR